MALSNKSMLAFSVASLAISAASLTVSAIALNHSSAKMLHERLIQQPEIFADAISAYSQRVDNFESASANQLAKREHASLYSDTYLQKIGKQESSAQIVEFMDYKCGYCRASYKDIERFVQSHPGVTIGIREYPILSPISKIAARYAIASGRQGKFSEIHEALLTSNFNTEQDIEKILLEHKIDLIKAKAFAFSKKCDEELSHNAQLAHDTKISGTPSFFVGDNFISGWNKAKFEKASKSVLS